MKILSIGIFGLLGVFTRFLIDAKFSDSSTTVPLTTFYINVAGCFIAGILAFFLLEKGPQVLTTGLLVGYCGGLTTFSGYTLQSLDLLTKGFPLKAILYIVLSPAIGLLVAYLSFHSTACFFSQN